MKETIKIKIKIKPKKRTMKILEYDSILFLELSL